MYYQDYFTFFFFKNFNRYFTFVNFFNRKWFFDFFLFFFLFIGFFYTSYLNFFKLLDRAFLEIIGPLNIARFISSLSYSLNFLNNGNSGFNFFLILTIFVFCALFLFYGFLGIFCSLILYSFIFSLLFFLKI